MITQLLFWRTPFRAAGSCSADTAARRLETLLSTTRRFSAEERLVGRKEGMRFRVWKRTLLGGSADVVQLEGRITQGDGGALVEGSFSYKAATKVQFIGFLAMGLFIAANGVFQKLGGSAAAGNVIFLGGGIAGVTAAWILGAYWMKDRQIEFLRSRIEQTLTPEAT